MPPKFTFRKPAVSKAAFVDRDPAKQVFFDKLEAPFSADYNIQMYYGMGGVGKSELCRELIRLYEEKYTDRYLLFSLNLETQENRNAGSGLLSLAESCKGRKVRFTAFERAYAAYFKRKYPDEAYGREKSRLRDRFGGAPGVALNIISLIDGGMISTAVDAAERVIDSSVDAVSLPAYIKDDIRSFAALPIEEIEEHLPAYFEYDIEQAFSKHPDMRILFIFDTFEALNNKVSELLHRNRNERWIKEFIQYFEKSKYPHCLFTIFGRDAIEWDDCEFENAVGFYELKSFDEAYSRLYLDGAGITEPDIVDRICAISGGYPLYLSLSVHTYESIVNSGRTACPDDFGRNYSQIMERFVSNLDEDTVKTLRVLSVSDFYTKDIFEYLIREHVIRSVIMEYEQFKHYSFIETEPDGSCVIHQVIREGLLHGLSGAEKRILHGKLCAYYENRFRQSRNDMDYLGMMHHACHSMEASAFYEWLDDDKTTFLKVMQKRGERGGVINAVGEIIEVYGYEQLDRRLLLIYIDIVHLGGDYEEAVDKEERYLSNYPEEQIIHDKDLLMMRIRAIHHSMFFKPVDSLIKTAMALETVCRGTPFAEEYNELLFLIGGNLGVLSGDFGFAEEWLGKSFEFAEKRGSLAFEMRSARKKADILIFNGREEEAVTLISRYVTMDTEKPDRYQIYLLGSLAEAYRKKQQFREAEYCISRVIEESRKRGISGWEAHGELAMALLKCTEARATGGKAGKAEEYFAAAEAIYNRISQMWGRLNSVTARCYAGTAAREEAEAARKTAETFHYAYTLRLLEEFEETGKIQYMQLFFL